MGIITIWFWFSLATVLCAGGAISLSRTITIPRVLVLLTGCGLLIVGMVLWPHT